MFSFQMFRGLEQDFTSFRGDYEKGMTDVIPLEKNEIPP